MSKQVLGKGLGALIPSQGDEETHDNQYRVIPLDRIAPNPMQPRKRFADERLAELAESLKVNGIMQPLVVKKNGGDFTIVAGERRFRAARIAGLKEVPTIIMDAIDDVRMLELALVENIQRENLNPIELAEAYSRLIDKCGLTQAQLAERVGKSRVAVTNNLRLLTLPDSIKRLVAENRITEGHARAILSLDSEARMLEMVEQIVSGTMSVREVEKKTSPSKKRRLIVKRKSPILTEIESDLKRRMGTSVRVVPGLKRGRIEIEYYGDEDLDRLWQLLKGDQS